MAFTDKDSDPIYNCRKASYKTANKFGRWRLVTITCVISDVAWLFS